MSIAVKYTVRTNDLLGEAGKHAAENNPRRLIFQVPNLPAGSYSLEVRATADDSDDVRAGSLDKRLTVVPPAADPAVGAVPAGLAEQCPEGKGRLPFNQR